MNENNGYKYLGHKPRSNYKQLYIKGRNIRARILYGLTIGEDPQTPEEIAKDYDLPLEAVMEAIDYCIKNQDVLREDYDRETANLKRFWEKYPPVVPPGYIPNE